MFNRYAYNTNVYQGVTNPRASTGVITAVHRVESGLPFPKFIAGGKGGTGGATYGVFKKATSYTLNIWKSARFIIEEPFNIKSISFGLTTNLNVNHQITPILDIDNGQSIVTGTEINNTNYTDSPNNITLGAANFNYNVHGNNNFCIQFNFIGSALIGILLPITIEIETETLG